LSRFLRFVVERNLEGKDSELKESVIGIEVFGRRPDFDPRRDPVVRTEAGRLRSRLSEYYVGEGKADAVVIELPKGGYVPRFREVDGAPAPGPKGTPSRLRLGFWVAAALACFAVVGWWWTHHRGEPITIAVLPLENVSHDPANDYFAVGLTDELIRNLAIIDGVVVRSRTSSFGLKNRPRNIREAGEQLQADYILEGSVLRAGERLRIDAQLVRVRDDFPAWSGRFDREMTDVFAIQDEISLGIVNNLRLKLGRGRRRYETSVEAYDLYLHARALPQRNRIQAIEGAGFYRRVISKDALFAPAYAGLAAAYAFSSQQGFEGDHGDELMQMRAAAEKAIQLDPLLSEAHQALAMMQARDGRWVESERSFWRAIELDPSNSMAYADFTMLVLLPLGRIGEALHEMRLAEKRDPVTPTVRFILAWMLISAGQYDEAARQCEKLPAEVTNRTECLGRARLGQGRIDEAIRILATEKMQRYLGYAYGRAGRREDAEKLAAAVAPNAFSEALIFAGLGDKDRTLEALDRVAPLGAARIGWALNDPEFALVRGDPRVKALRKKVGLPE
jgi:TolB-like protein/Flp pilus assembly protein TadD